MSTVTTVTNFLSNLISNPFSTPVGQLIERATDVSQASEDWGLYMQICDLINESEDGPKDAVRAIKKLISNNIGKSNILIMYTLTILETCVKNCGKKFHVQVAQKDFLQELIKLASPRNNPPHFVLDKVLGLIQTWADAFKDEPELKEFGNVYEELKEKGCEFPMTDLDNIPPIHTPARSVPQGNVACNSELSTSSLRSVPPTRQPADGAVDDAEDTTVILNTEQVAKLLSELDVVQQNCRVFGDLLTEVIPGQEQPDDYKLMQDLDKSCHEMQTRIVELIERVQNEDMTGELLHVNDLLNNVELRYQRFERLRCGGGMQPATDSDHPPSSAPTLDTLAFAPPAYVAPATAADPGGVQTATLVDIDDISITTIASNSRLPSTGLAGNTATLVAPGRCRPDEEEFDMFAQSRQSFEQNLPNANRSAYQNQEEDQAQGGLAAAVTLKSRGTTFKDDDEMEQWLKATEDNETVKVTATSSEFDKFLATREKEVTSTSQDAESSGQRSGRSGRTLQKADEEQALFSL